MPLRTQGEKPPFQHLTQQQKELLYEQACQFISDNKKHLLDRLAPLRTRHLTVVLEDIYQPHNASAVLRSCDCFGIQDLHVIQRNNPFNPAPDVAVGASKWVDYYTYPSTPHALQTLKAKGYRIVATLPHHNDQIITDLDISQPTALLFGTELTGLSTEAVNIADAYVKIPMYGFTESFNISVSVALSLFSLTEKIRRHPSLHWQMTHNETLDLKLHWASQIIPHGPEVLRKIAEQCQST